LNQQLLEAVYALLLKDEDMGSTAIQVLNDIAETEPKFFKKHFDMLFNVVSQIFREKSIVDMGIKKIGNNY